MLVIVRSCSIVLYSRIFDKNWMISLNTEWMWLQMWFVLSSSCEFWSYFTFWQDPSASVDKRREVVLRCLVEYMGERQEDLISVYHVCLGLKSTFQIFFSVCIDIVLIWGNCFCSWRMGHLKLNILSSFTHNNFKFLLVSFFCQTQNKSIWKKAENL